MPGKIFISYRREDERSMAARVRDRLVHEFGEENVFMDVDNLLPGQRFDAELKKALDDSSILLAVVGPRWMELLEVRQKSGERDFVREEIGKALASGITVIPLMLEGAPMPRAADLPEDIRDFVMHHKHTIGHEQFGRDVAALVDALHIIRGPADRPGFAQRLSSKTLAFVAVGVLGAIFVISGYPALRLPWSQSSPSSIEEILASLPADFAHWESVASSGDIKMLEGYLAKYPIGAHAKSARRMIELLNIEVANKKTIEILQREKSLDARRAVEIDKNIEEAQRSRATAERERSIAVAKEAEEKARSPNITAVLVLESNVQGIAPNDVLTGDNVVSIPFGKRVLVSVARGQRMRQVEIRGKREGTVKDLLEPEPLSPRLWQLAVELVKNGGASASQREAGR